jgi:hypothetical protein
MANPPPPPGCEWPIWQKQIKQKVKSSFSVNRILVKFSLQIQ